jgi:RHS repeat-associated protein
MIFDKTGSLAGMTRHDYLPFGEELFAGQNGRTPQQGYSADNTRQKFTEKERDNETGLDYFGARYYSSTQGRFTSVDPLMASARLSNPQTWNRYSYVLNRPVNLVDPNGMEDCTPEHPCVQADISEWKSLGPVIEGGTVTVTGDGAQPITDVQPVTDLMIMTGQALFFDQQGQPHDMNAEAQGVRHDMEINRQIIGPLIEIFTTLFAFVDGGDGEGVHPPKEGLTFDQARVQAFENAGMTEASEIKFTKVDPETGTVVEFKGLGGAKVAYDGPHAEPGPFHDEPHIGWQSAGKRAAGGAQRDNIPYRGPQHPSRSPIKGQGVVDPH